MKRINLAYLLPNFFTALSAFFGVMAIIASSQQKFEKAFIYIVLSLIADGLDGRVARMTNTTSKFGVEFDSLADLVAFGVAPAMMLFFAAGHEFGRFGALVSGLYVVFGAIRLARFNVTTGELDPRYFIGLPIPTAAVVLSSWIMLDLKYEGGLSLLLEIGALFLAFLMVSNFRYPSFKKIDFNKSVALKVLVGIILVASLIYLFPIEAIAGILTIYTFYGFVRGILNYSKAIKKSN
ncbi:CDP-diacylglycerol--serine O-phosphatidyltransferase [Caminibacter pacificus]|jgi:CDP-diacylglycerol--serine O-phosphatidyltransferase|uniref:CDP-diacylglycerol--serine O-phosphatidyltransferase n=1 Tax=Caminibacter pacificus TaxID=1424653 RepID=A0AAJ4UX66_9BACT|nr:CDP-diacylglycerol--serine O-phosphatidyltransferase [Caminibacter pacificus]NPA88453.1 CDP-diacylglycerol--serine O-phosphatidyltransferase [Campylobacterota bacterium]QCI27521.1 CDP-diacylglycerol--serine O-phosphatidyltransferase [Caminibacter pacificus]ROR38960.1 CDP-diacylglycerol--serine O-phosphatidyltransferase [Caminibacter pacificus]